jgi:Xaa-Pro aminopeptidase
MVAACAANVTGGRKRVHDRRRSGPRLRRVEGLDTSIVDLPALRVERLERLQAAMRAEGADVALFFMPGNIRYATGTAIMTVYSMSASVRCALVPAEGSPVVFEHAESAHVSARIAPDVRPFVPWEYFDDAAARAGMWADEIVAALTELGTSGSTLYVDKLATPAFLALAERGVRFADAGPFTIDAREVKTPQELRAFAVNAQLGMRLMRSVEDAVRPGAREIDILASMTDTLLRNGGEYLITRAVVSGPNTNPWNLEATEREIGPGELVFVDTDAFGWEGYFVDLSRTFLCGDAEPTPTQRGTYRAAHDWLAAARDALRPGITFRDFAAAVPELPERYRARRYEALSHAAGLDDEGPSAAFADDPHPPNPDREIKPGMVLCLEAYFGAEDEPEGVKLEDQVEVTADGCRVQIPYPFSDVLLG